MRHPQTIHRQWDPTLEPSVTVESGTVLDYQLLEGTSGQLGPDSTSIDLAALDWSLFYPLAGPVFVSDAEPGDVLEIEVLELIPDLWGWTGVLPGFGLLPEDFPDPFLYIWDLSDRETAGFMDIARIPIRPFCGTMGVTPDTPVPQAIMPPGVFGGNFDCRDLVVGSRLWLPVQVPGGLFSVGDPHAAQGDGEVCVSAIECPMQGSFRLTLHKGRHIPAPQFFTKGPLRPEADESGFFATMGIADDLLNASQNAVRAMVDYLSTTYHMEPIDAYVLASVTVDLHITELVDRPMHVVSAYIPLSVFNSR